MMERHDAGSIFRTDAATQQEWNIAIIFIQYLPVKLLTTSAHRLTFGVEKEVVNSAYILLIFLNFPATQNLNTQPELVKQMIDEGHIVGNHTVNHKSMPTLTEKQINSEVMDLHKSIYNQFGYEMKYIRPPMGEFSEKSISVTNSLGYKTVMWSFAYEDWNENKQPEENSAKKKIIDNVHNGEVMLLHGNSKTNTNILGDIINEIKNMGYEFKSLDEFEK